MKVAVIGAGVAGLTTAKVLTQAGHEVEVFDRTPDVGGVWSSTRRYPGLTTQSPSAQYSFSDFAMPRDLPEWPTGAEVQQYLADYATAHGLDPLIRLSTSVTSVAQTSPVGDAWEVRTEPAGGGIATSSTYDRVVVANGVFCEPHVPTYDGAAEFTAAGGQVLPATSFGDSEQARDRHVLVVGYGKTACDVSVAISHTAASTDVIARQLLWKVPRRIAGVVNFKMLLLTRMGEALFRYVRLRGVERFLHGPGNGVRRRMLDSIGSVSVRQFKLGQVDLVPRGSMEGIVKGAIGLATEGFFEGVQSGTIRVHRDQTIARLLVVGGQPSAELADGTVLPADLVVCATGFTQGVDFLEESVQRGLFDERGNFMLYRQIQPVATPGLYFNGYNSSFFSPLNAEMAALWIAADLAGLVATRPESERRAATEEQLAFMDEAVDRHHCRGTKIIPFSMKNVDEVLGDLDLQISRGTRASHWLNPVAPSAYAKLTPRLLDRIAAAAPTPTTGPTSSAATVAPLTVATHPVPRRTA